MNNLQKTADEARKLLRGFAAVQQLADAFEQAGSLQQAVAEAQTALEAARKDLAKTEGSTAKAKALMADAKDNASHVVAMAKLDADKIKAEAQAEAAKLKSEAAEHVAKAEAGAADMINAAQAGVDELVEKRDALAKEVKDLEARAEKARAFIAKLKE